jgi:pyruvate/2-oxoglutarate dehydrogenase complex dihydrolipoamide dehydrogenase (E3) component
MKYDYDLIVIGAGSGGLTVASGASAIGAKVLLIEKEKIGGDCTHYGCVPSKALINIANKYANLKNLIKNYEIDIEKVLEEVKLKVSEIYSHETPDEIKKLNIDVEIGFAKFKSKNSIFVNGKEYFAKYFVISTGARARIPPIKGLEKINYLTNKEIFCPKKFNSITIIGSGPIGSELGQAFSNLNIKVNILERRNKILGREDLEASNLLEKIFLDDGINIFKNVEILKIEENNGKKFVHVLNKIENKIKVLESDEVLISVGRIPNIEGLDLENAGVKYDERGIFINNKTQTSNKNIFAIGDVARGFQFTHFANHQAKVALANIIFKIPFKFEREVIPRVTFTNPEIASVGLNELDLEKEGKVLNKDFFILKKEYSEIDRAVTDDNEDGFFKVMVNNKGYILGAVLVGKNSGELIGEISLAMKNKIKITKLADTIHPYPTYSYGLRHCADQFRILKFSSLKKKMIKVFFRLKGD